jgi:hypothetical protein
MTSSLFGNPASETSAATLHMTEGVDRSGDGRCISLVIGPGMKLFCPAALGDARLAIHLQAGAAVQAVRFVDFSCKSLSRAGIFEIF